MDLNLIWGKFLSLLEHEQNIKTISKKIYTGISFLYIIPENDSVTQQELNDLITHAAAKAMKEKRLTCELSFVRMKSQAFVYRVRFNVPQEKLFCCGNGCNDCVRFKNNRPFI